MSTIRWTEQAALDLQTITRHLSEHSPQAAHSFLDRLDKAVLQLTSLPRSGRVVPELERQNIRRYREVILTPWRLFYEAREDTVIVLAIIDGRRNIQDVLLGRLTRPER